MDDHIPCVFVSYSHDSPEHKTWVANLAKKLRAKGDINVKLDQWDLRYGDDVPKYMERSVREADRVLMICTEPYVRKANERQGGVGYEAMIVTGELVRDLGTTKFIPVVKQGSDRPELPSSVRTRLYVNLSNEYLFETEFEKLRQELLGIRVSTNTPLGKNPYKVLQDGDSENKSSSVINKPAGEENYEALISTSVDAVYEKALSLAGKNNVVQWRKLLLTARGQVNEAIQAWRSAHEQGFPSTWQEILPIAVSGAATYAPLIAIALGGVESCQPKFNNQRAILDDILYPRNWNRAGRTILVEFPTTLAFVYQGLHGAKCLATEQAELAIKLISAPIEFPAFDSSLLFWKHSGAMGWPQAFEGQCTTAWEILSNLSQQWYWLNSIFGDPHEYKSSLCAYYMALNIFEYVDTLASGQIKALVDEKIHVEIPLCFESEDQNIKRRAYTLLIANSAAIKRIWLDRGIDDETVKKHWGSWVNVSTNWLKSVYRFGFHRGVTHSNILNDIIG